MQKIIKICKIYSFEYELSTKIKETEDQDKIGQFNEKELACWTNSNNNVVL